jgi:hypothetical protein
MARHQRDWRNALNGGHAAIVSHIKSHCNYMVL